MFIEAKTSYPLPFIFYRGLQLRYCGLLIFSCSLDYFPWSVLPLPLSELFIAGCTGASVPMSTYFNQVYDDNRWWTSRYQTL